MIWPELQGVPQIAVGRILNSLPEGLLIASCAWGILRLWPRQNSGTRFAVWFVALLTIVTLPFLSGVTGGRSWLAARPGHSLIVLTGRLGLLIFVLWILAASIAILRLAVGLWRLRGLRRSCRVIDAAKLDPLVQQTLADFRSSRSLTLATSQRVKVPAAIGFFRPMIVLPSWALRELSAEELRVILLHELAHLRRWDDWTNLIQKLVRAVLIFHPAAWWIDNNLSLEREMACDDAVLAETANPRGYAQCLISLLERNFARRGWAMAQAAVHRAHEVSLRLTRILDANRPSGKRIWKPAVGFFAALSVICLLIMPQAPRFVAVQQNRQARDTGALEVNNVTPPLPDRFELGGAAVIPAALNLTPAPLPQRTHQHRSDDRRPPRAVLPQVAGARRFETPQTGTQGQTTASAVPASAPVNQAAIPASETLLMIRTTERVGQNLWVSSVYLYRLDWVIPTQTKHAGDRTEARPIAKKT